MKITLLSLLLIATLPSEVAMSETNFFEVSFDLARTGIELLSEKDEPKRRELTSKINHTHQAHKAPLMTLDNFTRHVILLSKIPNIDTTEEQVKAHVSHLQNLEQQDLLELAGPFIDWEGGMIIIKAKDKAQAIEIAKSDPFVKMGVRNFEVRTWQLSCEDNNHLGVIS